MPKAPPFKKAPAKRKTGGSLAAAKAQVARLEAAQKRKTAVAAAEKQLKTARANLAKAKKTK